MTSAEQVPVAAEECGVVHGGPRHLAVVVPSPRVCILAKSVLVGKQPRPRPVRRPAVPPPHPVVNTAAPFSTEELY